eukprot:g25211.t1
MIAFPRADLDGKTVFALHMRRWKRAMLEAYFPNARFQFLPLYVQDAQFNREWRSRISRADNPAILVWGMNASSKIAEFAESQHIPLVFMEDGFIRSLVGSASNALPLSLTVDSRRPYFDARGPSDLECLLNSYPFEANPELIARARKGIELLLTSRLSKYNSPQAAVPAHRQLSNDGRRVLVIGQVEDDASIRYGCHQKVTNNDLVRLAADENPGSSIIYKPHPDVLMGVRRRGSDPDEVAHLAEVVRHPVPLPHLLDDIDHVYTITSLAGFEALLRGLPVTVVGSPFYSGWGLTDDRQENSRRGRKLTIEELFAAAYLLYPRYFNPVHGTPITFESCIDLALTWSRTGMPPSRIEPHAAPAKPPYSWRGPYGLLGWRHLMSAPISGVIAAAGNKADAENYRHNPILFFRELSDPRLRTLGRAAFELGLLTVGIATTLADAHAAGKQAAEERKERRAAYKYACELSEARGRADELGRVAIRAVRHVASLEAEVRRLRVALDQRQAHIDRMRNAG